MPRLSIDGTALTDAEQRLVLVMLLDATVQLSQKIIQGDAKAVDDYASLHRIIDRVAGREPRTDDEVKAYIRKELMPQQQQPKPRREFVRKIQPKRP